MRAVLKQLLLECCWSKCTARHTLLCVCCAGSCFLDVVDHMHGDAGTVICSVDHHSIDPSLCFSALYLVAILLQHCQYFPKPLSFDHKVQCCVQVERLVRADVTSAVFLYL